MTWQVDLPAGGRFSLAESVRDRLSCGILVCDEVRVSQTCPGIGAALAEIAGRLSGAHSGSVPSGIPGLAEARTLYKSFGMDPSRHRPSSEALLRRVLKGRELYRISNVVDCCNLASLEFLLPIGLYDLDRVEGDVALRTGSLGEEYEGIRKGPVHLVGRLGLFDGAGPFGSPTSDSARTCVSSATRRLLAVIMATAAYPAASMTGNLTLLSHLFAAHCSGTEKLRAVLGPGA